MRNGDIINDVTSEDLLTSVAEDVANERRSAIARSRRLSPAVRTAVLANAERAFSWSGPRLLKNRISATYMHAVFRAFEGAAGEEIAPAEIDGIRVFCELLGAAAPGFDLRGRAFIEERLKMWRGVLAHLNAPTVRAKPGSRLSDGVAASVVASVDALGGAVTAQQLVDAARDPNHPLHASFEWGPAAAADARRLDEARHLLRSVASTDGSVRALGRVFDEARDEYVYRPMAALLEDENTAREVIDAARAELAAFRSKYAALLSAERGARAVVALDRALEELAKGEPGDD